MTTTFAHPSLVPTDVGPFGRESLCDELFGDGLFGDGLFGDGLFGSRRRPGTRRLRGTAVDLRARRARRLGVFDAWRLLSDDPPSFGDEDD